MILIFSHNIMYNFLARSVFFQRSQGNTPVLLKFLFLIAPEKKKKTVHSIQYLNSYLRQTHAAMQLATEFSFCHGICPVEITVQHHSHVADREARGSITLLCFGSGLGKLLRQLLFVACNAVSSYSAANSLPPQNRPQRGWKKEKLRHLLTRLTHVSIEGG